MNEMQDNRQHELDLGIPAAQEELARPVRDEADHGPADVIAKASSTPTIDEAGLEAPGAPEVKEAGDAAPARTADPIEPPMIDEAGHEAPRAPEALGVKNAGTTRTADPLEPLEPLVIDDAALSRLAAKRRRESEETRLKLGVGTPRDEAETTSPKAEDELQKPQGRDDAAPTPPDSQSPKQKEDRGQRDQDEEKEFVTPESLRKRYLQADTKFYYRNQDNKLAFEIQGRRLATEHNDPEVAKSMVELGQAQGWQSIRLKGTEEFKREVWLQASLRGMTTQGYEPRDVDLSKLADMRTELDRGAGKARNIVEATVSRSRDAQEQHVQRVQEEQRRRSPVAARRGGLAIDEHHQTLSPKERQALDTLTQIQRQRGDSPEAVSKTADAMAERFQKRRVHVGRVLQHGHAPYDNDPQNEGSYYVTLRTAAGSKTVWGVDLERALEHAGSGVGDEVALAYQGRVEVGVVRNAHGEQAPKYRNAWEVQKLEYLREDERKHLVQAARSAERQPLLKVYDRSAERAEPRPEPVREPVRDLDRTRAGRG